MLWAFEHIRDRTLLDDAPFLHHCDAVGNVGDDAEIMGDEQHGHATPLLDVADQPENLRLRGDVERGGRFIRYQGSMVRAPAPSLSWRADADRLTADADSC